MAESPITTVLRAIDALDVDAFASLFDHGGRLLTTDGRVADGIEQVGIVIADFIAELRGTTHVVSSEWNPEPGVWIAELDATYDLRNDVRHGPYPRAIVLREGAGGIRELRIYGLHELPLTESTRGYQEVLAGGHWLPTL